MKNEISANSRAFQFQFDLQIQKIKLLAPISIPKSSYLQVIWRRGQKNISTKLKPQIKGNEEQIFFGQTLSMISTCALNTDTNQFNLKQSIVSAVIYISGSQKLFGSVTINLSSALNPNYMDRGVRFIQEQLNGRAKSKIYMKLSSNYLKEMMKGFDEQSIGSGINSNSYNNTSSYSIADRRTVDIPSKDTYSVVSYGGALRYSAKKDDTTSLRRQDSAKKFDDQISKQYGRYGGYTASNNLYAKPSQEYNLTQPYSTPISTYPSLGSNTNTNISTTANILTNLTTTNQTSGLQINSASNIKSVSSIQSSANRIPRVSQSQQNRSSVGGQQNSRLLIEQQTRRSKLEAQAIRNKAQNQQLRNKLTDYVKQNMRIKQELKKYSEHNDSKQAESKKQNEEIKQKNYVLSNEIRELKVRFQKYIVMQKQFSNLKSQRQSQQKQNKRLQQNLYAVRKQLQQTKANFYRTKDSQSRLAQELKDVKSNKLQLQQSKRRQLENKLKQLNGQLQYYQNNCKNLSVLLRQAQDKNRNIQRQAKNQQSRNEALKAQQIRKLNETLNGKQKQLKQLNQKLNIKNQQCTKYILQAQKLKTQFGRAKDDKIRQLQLSKSQLTADLQKAKSQFRDATNRSQQLQQQKSSLFTQLRNQQLLRSKQSQKWKQSEQTFRQLQKRKDQDVAGLRKASQQLQMENLELNKLLSEKSRTMQQNMAHKEELQSLMKQNLQLELELKYKNEESYKHFQLQEELQNIKCKYTIQEGNLKQLSDSLQKSQKELKQKNRAYILQCQKSKMLMEQRVNSVRSYGAIKDELEHAKQMIRNGQRQFQDMRYCIQDLEKKNKMLIQDIKKLQQKLQQGNPQKLSSQLKALQMRNRQLQSRDAQKIKSIQNLHRSLSNSNKQIKQLQQLSEQRYQQTLNRQHIIQQQQSKLNEYSQAMSAKQQQLSTLMQQKNSLAKKTEMIMQELYSYKKRLQQQRGRSHSTVLVRANSQDYIKIKNLQNELQKREQKMRKMEKQMMALESENVNLSIQVMKKLEDITPK